MQASPACEAHFSSAKQATFPVALIQALVSLLCCIDVCMLHLCCLAADRDEWVRAMAQSVNGFDGRLHNDKLLAGSKLVGRTVADLQGLLDAADPRLFRPLEVGLGDQSPACLPACLC